MSNEPIWKKMVIHSDLPERLKNLDNLANNLWWCWNYEAIEMFKYIDPELWAKVEKNPIALLKVVSTARLAELEKDTAFLAKFDRVSKTFAEYMSASPRKDMPLVGYFSMEYGLTDNLKIFSGGLGATWPPCPATRVLIAKRAWNTWSIARERTLKLCRTAAWTPSCSPTSSVCRT